MRLKAMASLVAVSVLAVMGLAACTNDTGGVTSGQSSGGGGDVAQGAVSWASTSSEKIAVEAIAAAFTEETGIPVELTIADTDNYQTTLRTQLSSGTAPDVFFTWPGDGNPMTMVVLQKAGLLRDLSDMAFASEVPEGLKVVSQIDGKTYIAPMALSVIGAIYNETAVAEAGLTTPTTWPELLTFCAAAKEKGKAAFALAAATPWNTQLIPYALVATDVYSKDADFEKKMVAGETTFATSAWVDTLNKNVEMAKAGCFQENYLGTTYEDALAKVADGSALGSIQVNSSLAAITDTAPEGSTFMLEPVPATSKASETYIPAAAGGSYGINVDAKNPDGAVKLMEFLTSEKGVAMYAENTAGIPGLPAGGMEVNPALAPMVSLIDEGRTYPFMDQLWPNAKVQQLHFEIIQQLLAGDTTAEDGLKQMDAAYQEK